MQRKADAGRLLRLAAALRSLAPLAMPMVMTSAMTTSMMSAGCGGARASAPGPAVLGHSGAAVAAARAGTPATTPLGEDELTEAAIACSSSDPQARQLYEEAYNATDRGDAAEAERKYLAAIARDPDYCDAMDNLALQYRRGGRLAEAIALYERSVDIAPHNEMGWQNLGYAYQSADRLDDALRAYQQILEMSPRNPEGWYGTGQAQLTAGRFAEARAALLQAVALYQAARSPLLDDAHMLLGFAAGGLKDWPAVRQLLEPLSERIAGIAEANLYLGEAYLQSDVRDPDKARRYLERARAQGAVVPEALWKRAVVTK